MIDPKAAVLDETDRLSENAGFLRDRVGSTLSGTGAAMARKVLRQPSLRLARDIDELRGYLGLTPPWRVVSSNSGHRGPSCDRDGDPRSLISQLP